MLKKSLLITACLLTPLFCFAKKDPNHGQAAPELTSAEREGLQTLVRGTLKSKAKTAFLIQLFNNFSSQAGQGETFIQQITVKTDEKGKAHFTACLPCTEAGSYISATATRSEKDVLHETSEFSNNIPVNG